ncbi:MAG TPA: amino acid adenylation domain-containing protein [Thermoanaerobaculia bacterium]|nr:amino acid adenylation domain-containing protein [Thermoanaerobaculia bacterium]
MSQVTLTGFELTAQQKRLWQVQEGEPAAFCAQLALEITAGEVQQAPLVRALQALVDRHEILRTTFPRRPGVRLPLQVVGSGAGPWWEDPVLCDFGRGDFARQLDELLGQQRSRPFDLARGPLLRIAVVRVARHAGPGGLLVLTLPALCCDGRGLVNLAAELVRAYTGPAGEGAEPLQYADFAGWQEELVHSEDEEAKTGRAFWTRLDRAALDALVLPGERPEGERGRLEPRALAVGLDLLAWQGVEAAAQRCGAPVRIFLLAAWSVLLWRLTGQGAIVIGELGDGRKYDALQGCVGLYACPLPVRSDLRARLRFREVVGQLVERDERMEEWREYGPGVMASLEPPVELPVGFEHADWPAALEVDGRAFPIVRQLARLDRCKVKLVAGRQGDDVRMELFYDPGLFPATAAGRLAGQLQTLLAGAAADPDAAVEELAIMPAAERHRALCELNARRVELPSRRCVHELFEAQAHRAPDRPAVVCAGRTLTYSELDAGANRLARHLRKLGVGPEDRVALFFERSIEAVVAILGVLKAGGAYVPLDPVFPADRLALMLDDARPAAVLTLDALAGSLPPAGIPMIRLDAAEETLGGESGERLPSGTTPENLLYVLFTSGSTGRPKGVAVEHRQMVNYLHAVLAQLDLPAAAGFAMVSTFAADLGHTALYPSLCSGGTLHVLSPDCSSDPDAMAEYFRRHPIDLLKIVPSHLKALGPERVLPRRCLVLGGEAAPWDLATRVAATVDPPMVLNHYGPTETTVGATTYRPGKEEGGEARRGSIPLGRPLASCRVFLLDAQMRPAAAGVAAELHIGGEGLARGYLGRPDLTAERFVPDPWSGEPGARVYRTGDLGRLLPDGNLEFLGRIDHQVKIRGFRIETGEIEVLLRRHPAVAEAAVIARQEGSGEKRLAAYVVPRQGRPPEVEDLRAYMRGKLPEYMVPPAYVLLASLPLTPNGKLDRQALPAPGEEARRKAAYLPPATPEEQQLAKVWSEVLGAERVGVDDNFFELGGDSILAIQVIARASRAGLHLQPRQIFQHQTVRELARVASAAAAAAGAEQGPVSGPVGLTPIQHWFFAGVARDLQHWNQALLFELLEPLEPRLLAGVVARLLAHHDALRMRFQWDGAAWRQRVAAPAEGPGSFSCIDLSALPEDLQPPAFMAAAAAVQVSFDLTMGPLARVVLFQGRAGHGRLLLVAHHLVVDGVSWRILLDDLWTAYDQSRRGEAIELPAKTTSFQHWAQRLAEHVRGGGLDGELPFWSTAVPAEAPPLPLDHRPGGNDLASARYVAAALDRDATRALLQEVPAVFRTQVNDALLAALVMAFQRWTGAPSLLVDLEGHGREPLFEGVDLSRTVGWFTTHYPVFLDLGDQRQPAAALAAVKEQLRRIPGGGIGYGLLRYLGGEALRERAVPEVSFNYLGQFDRTLPESSPLRLSADPAGPTRSLRNDRRHLFEVACRVAGDQLQVTWWYSERCHDRATAEGLAGAFVAALQAILAASRTAQPASAMAADFPLAGLDQEAMGRLAAVLDRLDPAAEDPAAS